MEIITLQLVKEILRPRKLDSNKGDYGHAMIIAGSEGKMGAAILAAKACLRSGVGLLTMHVPKCGQNIIQIAIPEAMVEVDYENSIFSARIDQKKYSVIGFGPGIGTNLLTQKAVVELLQESQAPMVIDADGLNCLSINKESYKLIPTGSILTPHPGEFERLVGEWDTDEGKMNKQLSFSIEFNCIIVLKGFRTSISTPEGKLYVNKTGNPGMAKGGSGDVLTGIITAFLAQGYSSEDAAILGVYIHGMAGDLAAEVKTEYSLLASDLIEFLPQAFNVLD